MPRHVSDVPKTVKEELLNQLTRSKILKSGISASSSNSPFSAGLPDGDDIWMEDDCAHSSEKRRGSTFEDEDRKRSKSKIPLGKGMEKGKANHTSVMDADDKEERSAVVQSIARWFYDAGIPLKAVKSKGFEEMINAIAICGPNMEPPSDYELRVTFLKREVALTKEMMKNHVDNWSRYGCSIMVASWTDGKQRCIINFLVSGVNGTVFIKSVDASAYFQTGEKLFELLDSFVEEIGEKNVLQVVTDNGNNYMLAGKLLMANRQHLYWTPSAAHCINSILEDIGKLPNVKKTIKNAIFLVGFIYNHGSILSTMRTYTENKELVRFGITRFVTTFLTLQRLHILKYKLKQLFASEEWEENKLSTTNRGNRAYEFVLLRHSFWSQILYALKVMRPLVSVLRVVYSEKKPAMGNIYEAMDMAKKTIQKSFSDKEDKYADVFKIIDERWNCQLHHPFYAAGHFLNPAYLDQISEGQIDPEVTTGLYACIDKLVPSVELQDKILAEIACYKRSEGIFDMALANRSRKLRPPGEWWDLFGHRTPNLQRLAVRILSSTCSVIGCELEWELLENFHFTKMNRLEHRRRLDVMYIRYNHKLKDRYNAADDINPLCLDDIDGSSEWMVGEMDDEAEKSDELVFHDDKASGAAGKPVQNTSPHGNSSSSEGSLRDEEVYSRYENDIEVHLGCDVLLEEEVDLEDDDDDSDYNDSDLDF